ncbi:MAG: diacylglycerol kinase family protein [Saprospiraceae bacterium]
MYTTGNSKLATRNSNPQKIRFIINPFSGLSRKKNVPALIEKYINKEKFDYDIAFTEAAGHAIDLTKAAVKENYDIVVAVGGDGSVNEVASALVGTKTKLGILPGGSGNGFAMHLGLGRNIRKAIQMLNTAKTITIDTCQLNGRPFVNLGGTGFDALVAYKAKQSTLRGLYAYTKFAILEAWSYPIEKYTIKIDEKEVTQECLVIEVANAQMFGYNFVIAPQAKFDDGLLDVLLVKKAPKWRYLFSLWRFFNASFHQSSLVTSYTGKDIKIIGKKPMPVHIDGEGYYLAEDLHFTILPLSLEILVPNSVGSH